jgi:hypothetical protein
MRQVRDAILKPQSFASAEFTTLRMRLPKIAARIAFAAKCPEAELFASLARCLQLAAP